jgi:hypothetical protein
MKNAPNSKVNLDKAIERFAGNALRAAELRGLMANAIVAQMIGEGVVKGGTGLRFRYGEKLCRQLFKYRQVHTWPPVIEKGENWEATYAGQKRDLPILSSVEEAVEWANELIARIENA